MPGLVWETPENSGKIRHKKEADMDRNTFISQVRKRAGLPNDFASLF
jgi:hypothetical protein